MKKLLALLLAAMMVACLFAGCQNQTSGNADYKVAMITDYGDINDQSFNQTTYEACKSFTEANNIEFKYYKPEDDSTASRVAMIDAACADGYNVIVMPGYAFAGAIAETQDTYTDVKFIGLDVSQYDLEDQFYNHDAVTGERTTLIDESKQPHLGSNVYCVVYQEELPGYMAGYAAVKLGYKHLGFLGGMAVPAVIRYGYGFVQGVNAAAEEMQIADQVTVEYVYGGGFQGNADITASMDTWFANGTEIVFACGGGIYTSACEAAQKANGKIIGVDVDQAGIIDGQYGAGMTVTSAMKGLAPTVQDTLKEVILNNNWEQFGGKYANLGLISADPEANYVQIPMGTTQFGEGFSQDDYKNMVKGMFEGTITVSNDTTVMPAHTVTVNDWGSIG